MSKFDTRNAEKFAVRMPPGMRSEIGKLASQNHRSMNSEILDRLTASLAGLPLDGGPPQEKVWTPVRGMLVEHPGGFGIIEDFYLSAGQVFAEVETFNRAGKVSANYPLSSLRPLIARQGLADIYES